METILFAMTKIKRGSKEYRKVLSYDGKLFDRPDNLEQSIDYNPATSIGEDEWYQIANFSTNPYYRNILPEESSCAYNETSHDDFGKIAFLCSQQEDGYHFQHITPARQINRKILRFGEKCRYEENDASINLNDHADAIYDPATNTLYFQKLSGISSIFDGMDELYREATDEEVREFLNYDFIELSDGYTVKDVGKNNRKGITSSLKIFEEFKEEEKKKVLDYIQDYLPRLTNSNGKFHIRNENDLKHLLWGIKQRYYTTPVGKEQRIANSIIPIRGGNTDG